MNFPVEYRTSLNIRKTIGNLLIVAMILILVSRGIALVSGEDAVTPVSVISSGSMEPTMRVGDVFFWTPATAESIREGDIVVYRSGAHGGDVVAHRVIEVRQLGTRTELITQGDANPSPDPSPVTESNLLGRVVRFGDVPFMIPYIGNLWLAVRDVVSALLGNMGAGGLFMLIPLITAGFMIIVTILILPEDEKGKEGKLKRLILGDQGDKIHPVKVFLILLVAFSLVIIPPSFASESTHEISLGVSQPAEPGAQTFSYVRPGQTISGNHTLNNYGFINTRIYTYSQGDADWLELEETYKSVPAGGRDRAAFTITVPEGTASGNYRYQIHSYYSPFWAVYPDGFVSDTLENDPQSAVLTLNMLTVVLFTGFTMGIMLAASLAYDEVLLWVEYHKAKNRKEKKKENSVKALWVKYTDWLRGVDVIDFDLVPCTMASAIALIAFPLAYLGIDLWILVFMVPLSSITAYMLGCRWRGEYYTAALTSAGLTIAAIYMVPMLQATTDLPLILLGIAMVIIILILLSPIVLLLAYLSSKSVHEFMKQKEPHALTDL